MSNKDIIRVYDNSSLIINDKYGRRVLSRIIGSDGIPNYFENNQTVLESENNISEVIFIPNCIRKNRFKMYYGYKYIFSTGIHNALNLNNDQFTINMSHVQMASEVCRFKYKAKSSNEIDVVKEYKSLYPTRIFDIQCDTNEVAMIILSKTIECINEYNAHYIGREI